ncbi:uncharacterized protein VTP21DRAFT_11327 [Calcarisporiella thermophila]|uniref:uncharacterized protein n=1 Tax=Calcarisporiella thermophila TaxID=911321 RepID=UPI003742FC8C
MRLLLISTAILAILSTPLVSAHDGNHHQINHHGHHDKRGGNHDAHVKFRMSDCYGFQLEEATLDEMQHALASRKLTSVQLTKCYIRRIKQLNPHLHSVIELNPDWEEIAAKLDHERRHGHVRGPLHGIPILVKDNIATKDKMNTGAGSLALVGSKPPRDAYIVTLLRKAGAIILGKSNMSEWADIRASSYSEGWSGRGGQTRNAYNTTQDPGGSSSGSAVSVAANMIAVAIGTETDGSVVAPAQRNGVVGIKPTLGLTSRAGVIPLAAAQDTVGCIGRTMRDAVHVLNVIRGVDPRDPVTREQIHRAKPDYTKYLRKDAFRGKRLGIPWGDIWQSPTTKNQIPQLKKAIRLMQDLGATVVNNTNLPHPEKINLGKGWTWMPNEFLVCKTGFKEGLNKYLKELKNSRVHSLSDIIKYNEEHADTEMPYFGQDVLIEADKTTGTHTKEYKEALRTNRKYTREEGIDYVLKKHRLDALIVPADNLSPSTQVPALAGYPMVTVPAGIDPWGVPFGIAFWGTAYSEPTLISLGYALEQRLQGRRKPRFLEVENTNATYPIPINPAYGCC